MSCTQQPVDESSEFYTLYFGNLHPYVSQKSLEDLNNYFGENTSKVIKDKVTGTSAGFGFAKFKDKKAAESALLALNGKCYLGQELRVNWALPNSHKEDFTLHHLFVGDLQADVTDAQLYNAFCRVGQCSDARVMWDLSTGRSKGYGFVSFRSKEDAENALQKMHGCQIGSRRIRCGWAQHKQDEKKTAPEYEEIDQADPTNTNVYIGNISPDWSELDLSNHFSLYGTVSEVKLHKKGGYGFVKYESHDSAVRAIVDTFKKEVQGRVLKCSWGKNTSSSLNSSGMSSASSMEMSGVGRGSSLIPNNLNFPMTNPSMAGALGGNAVDPMLHGNALQMLAAAGGLGAYPDIGLPGAPSGAYDPSSAVMSHNTNAATLQMMMAMMQGIKGLGSLQPSPQPLLVNQPMLGGMHLGMHNMYSLWDVPGGSSLPDSSGLNGVLLPHYN